MKTEYELRVLEIEPKSIMKRLEDLGANKIGDFEQKRYVYNLNPGVKIDFGHESVEML